MAHLLKPEQIQLIQAAIAYKHNDLTKAVANLGFAHHSTRTEGKAKLAELETLRSIFAKASTVIVHSQP